MPTLTITEAVEKIAGAVEKVKPNVLGEVYAELVPETPSSPPPSACAIARRIRNGLEPEEVVDLWNVVFPEDRNVRYEEETNSIRFNEELVGYAD
jgi:hypothetical protein